MLVISTISNIDKIPELWWENFLVLGADLDNVICLIICKHVAIDAATWTRDNRDEVVIRLLIERQHQLIANESDGLVYIADIDQSR